MSEIDRQGRRGRGWRERGARYLLIGLAFLLFISGAAASGRARLLQDQFCLACGVETSATDPTLMHRGREVALCAGACEDKWNANPELMFAALQPASALFTEERKEAPPMTSGWFWFGVVMVGALVSAAASGYIAVNRGQSPAKPFLIGLFGNLIGLILVHTSLANLSGNRRKIAIPTGLTKVSVTHAPTTCSGCGAATHPSAAKCSACGFDLVPSVASEVPV